MDYEKLKQLLWASATRTCTAEYKESLSEQIRREGENDIRILLETRNENPFAFHSQVSERKA